MATASESLTLVDHLPALQVMVPLLGSVACVLLRQRHLCAAVTIGCSLLMPVIAFQLLFQVQDGGTISYAMGGWKPPIGIEYRIDLIAQRHSFGRREINDPEGVVTADQTVTDDQDFVVTCGQVQQLRAVVVMAVGPLQGI